MADGSEPAFEVGLSQINVHQEEDDRFYEALVPFDSFDDVVRRDKYRPLPDDWIIAVTDVSQSTEAIEQGRYREVNTAGAAVLAAVSNALPDLQFPSTFGGDGASLAAPAAYSSIIQDTLARTAAWAEDALGLTLRIAVIPIADIRAQQLDVLVARFAPSLNVTYAMFAGGGLAWAERELKQGGYTVPRAPIGVTADLTGLSCRFAPISTANCLAAVPVRVASLLRIPVGGFHEAKFRQELVENTDYRKFDDGLRMTVDCSSELADVVDARLEQAQRQGTCFFGTHRQLAANLTCFVPSPTRANHVHFVDGASGGYAFAAANLKRNVASVVDTQ